MARFSRIRSIFVKELLETLRDRRTLVAMFVVPALLYPLMMVGVAKIQLREQATLETAEYTVAVPSSEHAEVLREIIRARREAFVQETEAGVSPGPHARFSTLPEYNVIVADPPHDQIGSACDVKVVFTIVPAPEALRLEELPRRRLEGSIIYRKTNVRSDAAAGYLSRLFEWQARQIVQQSMDVIAHSLRETSTEVDLQRVLAPVEVREQEISSEAELGGWVLSQIIPIVLVLMTVSGAVYPAIDLTAGERERGTLETLMVAPVHVSEVITGKFLVVTAVAVATAVLNVCSMGATFQFGGISQAISGQAGSAIPLKVFPIILLCLLPFAVLSSAAMLAVCSFARTFKEAQHYVMPVMIASMLPAAVGLMPTMKLEGAMLVMPIANLTLLTRDLFQQDWTWSAVVIVILSTSLYAAAAVAIATRLFGQEAVIFADSFNIRTMLLRKWIQSQPLPSPAQVLLPVALLFPLVFYIQSALQQGTGTNLVRFMQQWAGAQLILFVALPLAIAWYLKVDVRETFSLRLPRAGCWAGAVLLGASAWILAAEYSVLQFKLFGDAEQNELFAEGMLGLFTSLGAVQAIVLIAVFPGVCEEFLFRGFLQGGLRSAMGKWRAILLVGVIFGLFHLYGFKILVTGLLGVLLAWVCWQSGSIWPGILVHVMHNSSAVLLALDPRMSSWLGLDSIGKGDHLPIRLLLGGAIAFVAGLALLKVFSRPARSTVESGLPCAATAALSAGHRKA